MAYLLCSGFWIAQLVASDIEEDDSSGTGSIRAVDQKNGQMGVGRLAQLGVGAVQGGRRASRVGVIR